MGLPEPSQKILAAMAGVSDFHLAIARLRPGDLAGLRARFAAMGM